MDGVYVEIARERGRQDGKWGRQDHSILDQTIVDRPAYRMCEEYEIPNEPRARFLCEESFRKECGTYMHILVEEISEVASCGTDVKKMRQELIQCAAVVVAMIESLDRNGR